MDRRDIVGAGIGSGLIGALTFGIVALMALQFQLHERMDFYVVGVAAAIGALLFGMVGRAVTKRLPKPRHP